MSSSCTDIACLLTSRELLARKEGAIRQVRTHVSDIEEMDRGYHFSVIDQPGAIEDIAALLRLEHDCCPFLDFQLIVRPAGEMISLTILGPIEAKEIIRDAFVGDQLVPG